jgi:hypothetical protein
LLFDLLPPQLFPQRCLYISQSLDCKDYSGVVEYYAQELVMTVKAGTPISEIKKQLKKNNQALSFYTDNDDMSIGVLALISVQSQFLTLIYSLI